MKEFRAGGKKALKRAGRHGRKAELTEVDREYGFSYFSYFSCFV
jgi:hypothetical protein